jgi:hypothetical protein
MIEPNEIGYKNISFNFGLNNDLAIMAYGLESKQYTVEIGLDGVYRITELPEETLAFKGEWLNEETFRYFYVNVGHTEGTSGEIAFMSDTVEISVNGPYGRKLKLRGVRE